MVVKTFGIKAYDCKNLSTPCDRIVLDGTRFINNSATLFGSCIVGTKLNNIFVNCEGKHSWTQDFFDTDKDHTRWRQRTLKAIDPKEFCKSWEVECPRNATCKVAIGTFAYKFTIKTNSNQRAQIVGNNSNGFIFKNAESGKPLPNITITTLDAFESVCAPILLEGNELILNSSEGSRERFVYCSLENGTCTIIDLLGFVLRREYKIHIYPREEDLFKATSLTVEVRECIINEESTSNGNLCRECGEASYNFDTTLKGKCVPCPESSNCTTQYIKPKEGYWHKSPCHARMKRCIVEEACKVQDRLETLDILTQDLDDCNLNDTTLSNYTKVQCQKVTV